jgi:hypothetical protein
MPGLIKEAVIKLKLDGFQVAARKAKLLAAEMQSAAAGGAALKAVMGRVKNAFGPMIQQLTQVNRSVMSQAVRQGEMARAMEATAQVAQRTGRKQQVVLQGVDAAGQKFKTTIRSAGQEAQKAGRKTEKEWKKATRAMLKTIASGDGLRTAFRKVGFAVAGAGAAFAGMFTILGRGERVIAIKNAFVRLSGGVEEARRRLNSMKEATKGLMSSQEMMLALNKLTLMGMKMSSSEMKEATKAAIAMGAAQGFTAAQSVEDLTSGLARGSMQILDNIGLNVKLREATEAYAASLGLSVDEMTKEQRQRGFLNAVTKIAIEQGSVLAAGTDDQVKTTQTLATAWKEVADRFSEMIAKNPKIVESFKTIAAGALRLAVVLAPVVEFLAQYAAIIGGAFAGAKAGAFLPIPGGAILGALAGAGAGAFASSNLPKLDLEGLGDTDLPDVAPGAPDNKVGAAAGKVVDEVAAGFDAVAAALKRNRGDANRALAGAGGL